MQSQYNSTACGSNISTFLHTTRSPVWCGYVVMSCSGSVVIIVQWRVRMRITDVVMLWIGQRM